MYFWVIIHWFELGTLLLLCLNLWFVFTVFNTLERQIAGWSFCPVSGGMRRTGPQLPISSKMLALAEKPGFCIAVAAILPPPAHSL